MLILAYILLTLGTLITLLNIYTSFLRYPLHRVRGGTRANFKWVSGCPIVGSALLWLSLLFFPYQIWITFPIVLLSLADTGGLHWFAAVMFYQWLAEPKNPSNR